MVRRSSRLRKVKRVDYDEDALWDAAVDRAHKQDPRVDRERAKVDTKPTRVPGRVPGHGRIAQWENRAKRRWGDALGRHDEFVEDFGMQHLKDFPREDRRMLGAPLSGKRRQLLWMMPGDKLIREAGLALKGGGALPAWASKFPRQLSLKGSRLHFEGLPFAWQDEKRDAVKQLYFTPSEPSTILPITDRLYGLYANISKKNVTNILKSIETYQINFPRRLPPKISNRTLFKSPGVIAMDNFFPSGIHGWRGNSRLPVIVFVDAWSRYVGAYALSSKKLANSAEALRRFLAHFASMGHLPRRILADKGTDLPQREAREIMERYRLDRDRDQPMVINSATGQPVLVVENVNAQIQRRLAVFRTSGLTDDVSTILPEIVEQMNNQKRPRRGNLTPIQLLQLSKPQRDRINADYKLDFIAANAVNRGLAPLRTGDTVRVLLMTRKEQEDRKQKGFAPKWSGEVFSVIRRYGLRRNPGVFRYEVGLNMTFYRHELLKIPKVVDRTVPGGTVSHREHVIAQEERWGEAGDDDYEEYDPLEEKDSSLQA